jgi:hypothetical protein
MVQDIWRCSLEVLSREGSPAQCDWLSRLMKIPATDEDNGEISIVKQLSVSPKLLP